MKHVGWCRRPDTSCSAVFQTQDGHRHVGELLPQPLRPFYPNMHQSVRQSHLVEMWIDAGLHARSWNDRTTAFDQLIRDVLASGHQASDCSKAIRMLAAVAGEHLCERQIVDADAARFYSISLHSDWREAGERFIRYCSATKNRKWLRDHPGFDRILTMVTA